MASNADESTIIEAILDRRREGCHGPLSGKVL